MTVSATSPIDQVAAKPDTTSAGRTRLAENFDMFLTLLTTQMKNQDPTSPMDSNQFMQQLVQMTGVEQQIAGNDLLKELVANTGTNLASVVDLIGKEVRAATDQATLSNGQIKWGYTLGANAADVKVDVLDSRGISVRTISMSEADRKAGEHSFTWDGKDSTGAKLPDGGVYTLKVTARDAGAKDIPNAIFVHGLVTGIEQQDGQGVISLNGGKVPIGLITSVHVPVAANTNTNTETTKNPTDQTSDQAA